MKVLSRIITAGIFLVLISCSNPFESEEGEDFFYISRKNANMPVWVRGNRSSHVYMVVLHGGPGGSSTSYWGTEAFNLLEQEYCIVYWDQRSSGLASGTSTQDEMAPEELALDTELLIDVIHSRYNPADIFLFGHSWGGLLGTVYLSDPLRQEKVSGWIEMDGGHNWPLGMELSVDYVRNHAQEIISFPESSPSSKDKWEKVLQWYEENPLDTWNTFIPTAWSQHTEYVWDSYGYVTEEYCSDVIEESENSPMNIHQEMNYTSSWSWFTMMPKIWTYDATAGMGNITLPTKIIWGREDGILPLPLAQDAYERLGTPEADKSITILDNSAHWIVDEQGEEMFNAIRDFIGTYTTP